MTAEVLSGAAGVVLSLALSYFPGLKQKWEQIAGDYKRLVMLALSALVALASYGLACSALSAELGIPVTCDQAGAVGLFRAFLAAAIANQAAYSLTPRGEQ